MSEFLILALIIVAGFVGLFVYLKSRLEKRDDNQSLLMLQQQLQEVTRTMDTKLGESTRALREQFGASAKIIRDVTERLTRLDETNKQVIGFADQLRSLQDILKNPKQRGVLGEYYLETVLKNVLPPGAYEMQYAFEDGAIVDAIVRIDKRVIPIDSKFSLENYNRMLQHAEASPERKKYEQAFVGDLKTRIDETAKYVKPEEHTMDFAFMFIPSEAVYYDLLINKVGAVVADTETLITYAARKKVVIVSPTSFLAYLQTVLQGLRGQKISEEARAIVGQVERLGKHLYSFDDYMRRVGKNLGTTVGMYNQAYKELGKIDKDVLKITGKAMDIEPEALPKPEIEDVSRP